MKKVIIVTNVPESLDNAPEIRARQLKAALLTNGVSVDFINLNDHRTLVNYTNCDFFILKKIHALRKRFALAKRIHSLIRSSKKEASAVIMTHLPAIYCFTVLYASQKNLRTIIEVNELPRFTYFNTLAAILDELVKRIFIYRLVDCAVVISKNIESYFDKLGKPAVWIPSLLPLETLSNCTSKVACTESQSDNEFLVFYSGKLKPEDGFSLLARAIARCCISGKKIKLIISGPMAKKNISEQIIEAGVNPQTISWEYLGLVSREDYMSWIGKCHVGILPRPICEENLSNFPTRLTEYFSGRLPVIIGASGDVGVVLKHKYDSFLLEGEVTPETIADAINEFYENRKLGPMLAENAYDELENKFGFTSNGKKLLLIIENTG